MQEVKQDSSRATDSPSTVSYQLASGGVEEILRPTLVVSGGRSYRKLTDLEFGRRGDSRRPGEGSKRYQQMQSPGDHETEEREKVAMYTDDVYDEGQDIETEVKGIEKVSNGNYKLRLPIPSVFFKYIIGKEGRVKKGIERDTECRLWLPGKGREGDVVIEGLTKSNVADAKRRVEIIVWTNRDKERPTHFISIPLTEPHFRASVTQFTSSVLETCSRERGVNPEVFQQPEKLHLTLGVLRIFTPEEEERAKAVVKGAISEAKPLLGSLPVVICVEGVDTMKDDPTAVDVLFARVFLTDKSDRLQAFVDAVQGHVMERAPDLMNKEFERDGVKLHATLMNSRFPVAMAKRAADSSGVEGNWRRRGKEGSMPARTPFDATKILQEFREFRFGQQSLETLHLSKRKEYGPDGFYRCVQDYPL